MDENKIGDVIVDSAVNLHREPGPGLLEIVYQLVFARELEKRGLKVEREVPVAIKYKGVKFDQGFRADLIIEQKVIIELESVDRVSLPFNSWFQVQ